MDRRGIEVRVGAVVDRVTGGGRVEDDYTECKAVWPTDHRKAARQIAALCNAARGADALWIIGLDDAAATVTPTAVEPVEWWSQVAKWFDDDVAPEPTLVVVPTAAGTVTAIAFRTDRSPYVIKTGEDRVHREVPWRTATGTASAKRHQLLSILVANAATPELELINPAIDGIIYPDPKTGELKHRLTFQADLFISAREDAMLPNHRWSLTISSTEWDHEGWGPIRPNLRVSRMGTDEAGPGVRVLDHSGIYLSGSGRVRLHADFLEDSVSWSDDHKRTLPYQGKLQIALDMPVDGQDRSATATAELTHRPGQRGAVIVVDGRETPQPQVHEWRKR